MKIGYLHLGFEEHGIRRYSQFIAAEAQKKPDVEVVEASVILSQDWQQNRTRLVQAAKKLSEADVIHFQHNRFLWGGESSAQLYHLWSFIRHCSVPLVVTMHDIYLQREPFELGNPIKYFRHNYGPYHLLLHWLLKQVRQVLVCNHEEARRLYEFLGKGNEIIRKKIDVIPHFVEDRTLTLDRDATRRNLGLNGFKVITLLGWIHPGKGHQLAIAALPHLPKDVKLVFAGEVGSGVQDFMAELESQVQKQGVADRFQVTGYLSDPTQEEYLIATDLAICPFREISASGSLSTWISVAKPILASDLPQIREYNDLEPGAIQIFQPYTPTALATAIQQQLSTELKAADCRVARLKQQLSMPAIVEQHLARYRSILPTSPAIAPREMVKL